MVHLIVLADQNRREMCCGMEEDLTKNWREKEIGWTGSWDRGGGGGGNLGIQVTGVTGADVSVKKIVPVQKSAESAVGRFWGRILVEKIILQDSS